jgi:hypothetical protein
MWYDVSFGSSRTGIATVGYRQVDASGGDAVARTQVGVVEIGGGGYGVDAPVLDPSCVSLEWDTGGGSPVFAHESVQGSLTNAFITKLLRNRRETNPATGIQTIYDDDGTTPLVSGPIWEDVAGTTPYSATSTGIDRQDPLV